MDSFIRKGHMEGPDTAIRPAFLFMRLEKFDHSSGDHRYCVISLSVTLFGEWCVERMQGPLGAPGGQHRRSYFDSFQDAQTYLEKLRQQQLDRGYAPIPVQLGLL